jgi:lipid A ethanolaminephosphotransferase
MLLAVWITLASNLPLWRHLIATPGFDLRSQFGVVLLMMAMLLSAHVVMLAPMAGPRGLRLGGSMLLLVGAGAAYFIDSYGVVIDPSMIRNVVATDAGEALDLLSLGLLVHLLLLGVLPALLLWVVPIAHLSVRSRLGCTGLLLLAGMAGLLGFGSLAYADLAPLMRSYPKLRHQHRSVGALHVLRPGACWDGFPRLA